MARQESLRAHVEATIRRYFQDMGHTEPEHLYRTLLSEIEPPLIEETLKFTAGNQSMQTTGARYYTGNQIPWTPWKR